MGIPNIHLLPKAEQDRLMGRPPEEEEVKEEEIKKEKKK